MYLSIKSKSIDKSILINKTINNIKKLPVSKVKDVNDFVDFLLNRIEDQVITEGIQEIASTSKSFGILNNEPDLFTGIDFK
ncbi:MAG TPA: hypothetical protein PK252_10110 [Bacteroidales bacterium]|nr:hypothetical protein [Bacteroidales bacterium]